MLWVKSENVQAGEQTDGQTNDRINRTTAPLVRMSENEHNNRPAHFFLLLSSYTRLQHITFDAEHIENAYAARRSVCAFLRRLQSNNNQVNSREWKKEKKDFFHFRLSVFIFISPFRYGAFLWGSWFIHSPIHLHHHQIYSTTHELCVVNVHVGCRGIWTIVEFLGASSCGGDQNWEIKNVCFLPS